MAPVHGRRVIGDDAYDKAVREEVGGVHTFGVRVRGAIPENGPTNIAKRATEHGPLVVADAKFQDNKGRETDGVSIDDIRSILAENPTFLDSLYEAELARPSGARLDAVAIFYEVERGIKGQMRRDIMDEMQQLINEKRPIAGATADFNQARLEQADRMRRRGEDNAKLVDSDRLQALADREENLQRIREAESSDSSQLTVTSPNVERQVQGIADEKGLELPTPGGSVVGKVPAKPDGEVNPETQQPGERLGVPKGDEGEGTDGQGGQDFESMTKAELEAHLGDEAATVKGSGSDGAVLKADLVKAAKKAAKNRGK